MSTPNQFDYSKSAFGYLFNTVGKIIDSEVSAALKDHGLQPQMLGILSIVKNEPDLQQKDYSDILVCDVATFGRLVDKLEEMKLIKRVALTDRRAKGLILTKQGSQLLVRTSKIALGIEQSIMEGLESDETQALRSLMHKVLTQLRLRPKT